MTSPNPQEGGKHTLGPWFVAEDDSNGQAVVRNADIEVCTCWHHCVGSIEKEMRANARLIAAAPSLLEACREIIRTGLDEEARHGDQRQALALLRAALLQATGGENGR